MDGEPPLPPNLLTVALEVPGWLPCLTCKRSVPHRRERVPLEGGRVAVTAIPVDHHNCKGGAQLLEPRMTTAKYVYALDPGLHGCGVAVAEVVNWEVELTSLGLATTYCPGELTAAFFVGLTTKGKGPEIWRALAQEVARALARWPLLGGIHEIMKIYPDEKDVDPNDLAQLMGVGGAVAATVPVETHVVGFYPREWKGAVPRKIYPDHVQAKLQPGDRGKITLPTSKKTANDVWHAVGLVKRPFYWAPIFPPA